MAITLTWSKKDTDDILQGYEIYRSTDKTTVFQAGNKLASSNDKSLVSYTDATTFSDVPYWYGVRSLSIYGTVDSTPVLMIDPSNVGMGPVVPMVGDFEDGYVESYVNDQTFTAAANTIYAAQFQKAGYGIDWSVGPVFSPNASYRVNKFWRNGKVLFAPNHPVGGVSGSITFGDVQNAVITPLVNAKPRVEIAGIQYDFIIMTWDEAVKYLASGATTMQNQTVNHLTERVVPKTFGNVNPNGTACRVFCRNNGDGTFGIQVDAAGALAKLSAGTQVTSWPVAFPWYFTPALS